MKFNKLSANLSLLKVLFFTISMNIAAKLIYLNLTVLRQDVDIGSQVFNLWCGSSDNFTNLEFRIDEFYNECLLWFLFQLANWENTCFQQIRSLSSFLIAQTEKNSWNKFVKKIREKNWWNYVMNSLKVLVGSLAPTFCQCLLRSCRLLFCQLRNHWSKQVVNCCYKYSDHSVSSCQFGLSFLCRLKTGIWTSRWVIFFLIFNFIQAY